jgi:hypothetical protein
LHGISFTKSSSPNKTLHLATNYTLANKNKSAFKAVPMEKHPSNPSPLGCSSLVKEEFHSKEKLKPIGQNMTLILPFVPSHNMCLECHAFQNNHLDVVLDHPHGMI